jgi:membrane associated rhomboid family serine protease
MRAGEFEVPAWMAITVYFATDLFGAVIGMFAKHGGGGGAFGAHGGGFLGGLALIYAYKLVEKRRQTEEAATDLIVDPA